MAITLDGTAFVNDRGNEATGEGINIDTASQYRVDRNGRRITVGYDALNSITPVGVSVDGRVAFEVGPDGAVRLVDDDRDNYPSQVSTTTGPTAGPGGRPAHRGARGVRRAAGEHLLRGT